MTFRFVLCLLLLTIHVPLSAALLTPDSPQITGENSAASLAAELSVQNYAQAEESVQILQNDPDGSLVYVSGQVHKLPGSKTGSNTSQPYLLTTGLSILGAGSSVDLSGLIPASGVEVRFWQADMPGVYIQVQTDEQGQYVVGLSDGTWLGEACGSDNSFYPAAWQLSVVNEKLVSMQAQQQKNIQLDVLSPSNLVEQGSVVTLFGRGFGCNGSLVFTYSNAVNRCDLAQAVEYDHSIIRVSNFISRSDTQLSFNMPELGGNREVMKHIASVQYQQGSVISQSVVIGEQVMPKLSGVSAAICSDNSSDINIVNDANGLPVMLDIELEFEFEDINTSNTEDTQPNPILTEILASDVAIEFIVIDGVTIDFSDLTTNFDNIMWMP